MNRKRNAVMPSRANVHRALAARPRNIDDTYSPRWDGWLMPRVTGHFTGTTDEIFQWGACKWGLSDNVLRAIAVRESTWYQYPTYRNGRCVSNWGCGDFIDSPTPATSRFCSGISRFGYDYQDDYGAGRCPRTFSIMGVMAWEAPSWGRMRANQNGTFPFSRDSTAYAVDYTAAYLRGCFEGWIHWLRDSGAGTYRAGRIWGCVGSWFSGGWLDADARGYIARVQHEEEIHRWRRPAWATIRPPCSPELGCPGVDPLKAARQRAARG
jgi:autotransporter family porin